MKPTTQQILKSVLASDETITDHQKRKVMDILLERVKENEQPLTFHSPLLLGGDKAAKLLGVSRTTLWRITKDGLLHPVTFRGVSRYRVSELMEIAQEKKP